MLNLPFREGAPVARALAGESGIFWRFSPLNSKILTKSRRVHQPPFFSLNFFFFQWSWLDPSLLVSPPPPPPHAGRASLTQRARQSEREAEREKKREREGESHKKKKKMSLT